MKVELIFDRDCPHSAGARDRLKEAFDKRGLPPRWTEWARDEPGSPDYARRHGSPTILVDGRDIAPGTETAGAGACRLYTDAAGRISGVPDVRDIEAAFLAAELHSAGVAQPIKRTLPSLPVIGVALLPKLTCAACWPAYTALLASFGVGFLDYTPYLLPLMAIGLTLTLILLVYRASTRRGYAPFALGAAAGGVILIGKFLLDSDLALYGGASLLVAASLWNAWPMRRRTSCGACETELQ
ncbi:MAG TPA: hypothetical protein VGA51_00205 [Casimicrobiaceae bacterium]